MSKKLSHIFRPNVFLDFGEGKIFSNKFAEGFAPPPRKGNQIWMQKESGEEFEPIDAYVPCVGVELGGDNPNNIKINIQDTFEVWPYGEIVHRHNEEDNELFDRDIRMPIYLKEDGSQVGAPNAPRIRTCIVAMPQLGDVSHDGVVYSKGNKIANGERFSVAVGGFGFDRGTSGYVYNIGDMAVLLCADPRRFQPKAYVYGRDTSKFEYGEDEYFYPEWEGFFPTDEDENNKYYKTRDPHYYFLVDGHKTEFIWLALGSFIQLKTVIEIDDETGEEITYWEVEGNKQMVPVATKNDDETVSYIKGHVYVEADFYGYINRKDEYNTALRINSFAGIDALADTSFQVRSQRFQHESVTWTYKKYHTDDKPWQWGAYINVTT